MKTRNKLDKVFGPAGSSAGSFLLIVGLIITCSSLVGLILILVGAFIGFTSTSTVVDLEKRRLKFSTSVLGFIPLGRWIYVEDGMTVGIKYFTRSWRAHSQGSQTLDLSTRDYRLVLYDQRGEELMPVKKIKSLSAAQLEATEISKKLGVSERPYGSL